MLFFNSYAEILFLFCEPKIAPLTYVIFGFILYTWFYGTYLTVDVANFFNSWQHALRHLGMYY